MSDSLNKVEEFDKAAQKTVDYLYKIEESEVIGKLTPELFQAISTLRQLINEEFKPQKSISSQLIYDIISPAINNEKIALLQALIDTEAGEGKTYGGITSDDPCIEVDYIETLISKLKKGSE